MPFGKKGFINRSKYVLRAEIIKEAFDTVEENNLWGTKTIISSKDWKSAFESFGIDEKDMPKWMYKGENWQSFNKGIGIASVVNDIWKSAWKQLEMQRMQVENQAEHMKKQLIKQQALNQNKEAIAEQIRKGKDRNSMYQDDELER